MFHPEELGIENAGYWTATRAEQNLAIETKEGVENQPYTRGIRRILKKFYNRD